MNVYRIIGSEFVGVIKWHEKGSPRAFRGFLLLSWLPSSRIWLECIDWMVICGLCVHFEQNFQKKLHQISNVSMLFNRREKKNESVSFVQSLLNGSTISLLRLVTFWPTFNHPDKSNWMWIVQKYSIDFSSSGTTPLHNIVMLRWKIWHSINVELSTAISHRSTKQTKL